MKRRTKQFLNKGTNSLVLAVEIFNRPSDTNRAEGVVMFLNHSFEMLLKAVIFEKTGKVRSPRERFNYGFEKCIDICTDKSKLGFLDNDDALILKNLNGFRDAAEHDVMAISEGLLYGHAQSAITVFGKLLHNVFSKPLSSVLPKRILPLSSMPPADIQAIFSDDLEKVRGLLSGKRRREDEAEALLRPYLVMEQNLKRMQGIAEKKPATRERALKRLKKQGDWKLVFPMISGLVQPSLGGLPITLHVTKRDGIPVKIDPNAATTIAFRYVKPEDKWLYMTKELGAKLGTNVSQTLRLVQLFGLKSKDEYHTDMKISKTGRLHRYSEKTYQLLKVAIQQEGLDSLLAQQKRSQTRKPEEFNASEAA